MRLLHIFIQSYRNGEYITIQVEKKETELEVKKYGLEKGFLFIEENKREMYKPNSFDILFWENDDL